MGSGWTYVGGLGVELRWWARGGPTLVGLGWNYVGGLGVDIR